MVDERLPPPLVTTRRRRRGPRSLQATTRRTKTSGLHDRRQPPSGSSGKSGFGPLAFDTKVTITNLNIRGFLSHQVELEAYLRIQGLPSIVGIIETLLDASTKFISLSGYVLVSRLDRRAVSGKGGGIALFVREEFSSRLVHVEDSEVSERSWHILHCVIGPILIGLWYRPPC